MSDLPSDPTLVHTDRRLGLGLSYIPDLDNHDGKMLGYLSDSNSDYIFLPPSHSLDYPGRIKDLRRQTQLSNGENEVFGQTQFKRWSTLPQNLV